MKHKCPMCPAKEMKAILKDGVCPVCGVKVQDGDFDVSIHNDSDGKGLWLGIKYGGR